MTTLLLGAGPRFDWLRTWLMAQKPKQTAAIKAVDAPTREALTALARESIDALILADHHAFAAGPPAKSLSVAEAVRNEGQRAVFALEVARRAARAVMLTDEPVGAWPAILAEVAGLPPPSLVAPRPPPPGANKEKLARPYLTLAESYLKPLFAAASAASRLVLSWPRESFLNGDAPGKTLPAAIEVAGRARILAYGPYLPLPAGTWRATAYLGFSIDIEKKMPFILEVDTGTGVTRGFFEVLNGGIFTLAFDFQVTDPLHPIELRLINQDSALDGQAALIEVRLEHPPS